MKKTHNKGKELAKEANGDSSTLRDILTDSRALFIVIASTVLVYANSLSGVFVFDDTKQIVGNPALRSWGNIARALTTDVWAFQRQMLTKDIPPPYYRPLFTVYLTINFQLFGLWEPGWHVMNLIVHTGATVTIYFLLRRLSDDRLLAMIGALIFGLHPSHVESVSWISGIPDPLAALFFVPSLIWYVRYRTEQDKKFLVLSLLAYGLSALCKETPLALPLVLIVWELTRTTDAPKRSFGERVREIFFLMLPYALVAGAYLALRFSVLGRISWKHPFMARVPDSAIFMTVPYVFISYLRHLVAPFYLSLIYGTSFVSSAGDARFLVPVLILLAIGMALWIYRKKLSSQAWMGLALTVAPLLPVLNLRVFHYEYIVQDRYLYLPSIGFSYLVALTIIVVSRRRAYLATALTIAFGLALGVSTIAQNRVWHDSLALWQRAVSYSPDSWSTHYNLGLAYLNLKDYEKARPELIRASLLNGREPTILNNLALAHAGLGDMPNAMLAVRKAIALDPTLIEAHNNLGAFLFDQSAYADARKEFSEVLAHDPSSNSARFNLGRTLAAMGNHAAAVQEFEAVLATQPGDVAARYELAASYAAVNRRPEAISELTRALQMDQDQKRSDEMRRKLELIKNQPQ
jgi:protein O-mannosyl-transferase